MFLDLHRFSQITLRRGYKFVEFVLFGLVWFYVPVNNYSHVQTVSSPNHTFSWEA